MWFGMKQEKVFLLRQIRGGRTKLLHDRENFWHIFEQYAMMQKNSEFDKENRLRQRKKRADKLGGKYLGALLKAITNPALIAFELRARRQERNE